MVARCRGATWLLLALLAPCASLLAQGVDKPVVVDTQAIEEIRKARDSAVEQYQAEAAVVAEDSHQKLRNANPTVDVEGIATDSFAVVEESLPEGALQSHERFAEEPHSFLVFASTSMPERDLLALLEVASDQSNVHVIFRGVPDGGGIDGFMKYLSELCKDLSIKPALTIDPPQWRSRGIKVVPTIVALEHGKEIGRATGTANPEWLRVQLITRKGDLGAYGESFEPSERDMADVIREAVAKVDTDALRRDAENNFWAKQSRLQLPVASEARVTRVDPSVEISRDVVLPDGKVLAKKGDRINPLLAVTFDQRLIVIDGADPRQRTLAKRLASEATGQVVVMSTQGPTDEESAETWTNWQNQVEQRMYLLTSQLQASLHVARVPTMIEADGEMLVLTEMLLPEGSP